MLPHESQIAVAYTPHPTTNISSALPSPHYIYSHSLYGKEINMTKVILAGKRDNALPVYYKYIYRDTPSMCATCVAYSVVCVCPCSSYMCFVLYMWNVNDTRSIPKCHPIVCENHSRTHTHKYTRSPPKDIVGRNARGIYGLSLLLWWFVCGLCVPATFLQLYFDAQQLRIYTTMTHIMHAKLRQLIISNTVLFEYMRADCGCGGCLYSVSWRYRL